MKEEGFEQNFAPVSMKFCRLFPILSKSKPPRLVRSLSPFGYILPRPPQLRAGLGFYFFQSVIFGKHPNAHTSDFAQYKSKHNGWGACPCRPISINFINCFGGRQTLLRWADYGCIFGGELGNLLQQIRKWASAFRFHLLDLKFTLWIFFGLSRIMQIFLGTFYHV